jgi:hypothetical protein
VAKDREDVHRGMPLTAVRLEEKLGGLVPKELDPAATEQALLAARYQTPELTAPKSTFFAISEVLHSEV